MMKQNELVPKRRFKGFTGEWEEYKLSDLAKISTGKAFSSTDFDDKGKYYVVTNKNIQDQSISIESVGSRINISEKLVLDNYVLRGNNILITMDGNVGRAGKYSDDNAVLAQRVARLNSKQFEFVYQITRKSQFISKMNEVSVGNIIKHISLKQISDYLFMAPKDKKEQQKIGQFFKNLDEMIVLQQRKLDKTRALKSAYLAEMFPAEGESVPKRRFSGFTEEWRSSKLENIINMHNNLRVPVTASKRITGDTPYYGANGIQDYVKGRTHDGEFVLIAEDGANDLTDYPVLYVNGEVWVNNHAHVVTGKTDIIDNLFLVSRMKSMDISKWLVGGGRAKLNAEVLKNIQIKIPDFKEQIKIGEFFKKIDGTILIHQQKLEKLKATKQAYLHEMFV